jgi:hypothetical protein
MSKLSNTQTTINKAVIRDDIGRLCVRQCHPKLKYVPRVPLASLTSHDIEQRIRHNLHLIAITRGR